ncbi:hypothetical protein P154DRAFT_540309 [Amniculicola lignicola CBS 123094]|uniref:Uncharacterized protein n=1 Tax=Amniculicola lignicola CBS 123094 TaxID=1392246 RepID=A0A6A5VW21_9PLEO|nr:hypothetical protein P154DRAFT_540309 [Amniculicola lignicola CBS 123094]
MTMTSKCFVIAVLTALSNAAYPSKIDILSTTLRQCPDFTVTASASDPAIGIDVVSLIRLPQVLYKPNPNTNIASYGPSIPPEQNLRRCYLAVGFNTTYSDLFETEQMRIGSVDYEIADVNIDKNTKATLQTFLTWIDKSGNAGDGRRQDFTLSEIPGPLIKKGFSDTQKNTSRPVDALCMYTESTLSHELRLWNYFSLGPKDEGTLDGQGTMSGEVKVKLRFAWKRHVSAFNSLWAQLEFCIMTVPKPYIRILPHYSASYNFESIISVRCNVIIRSPQRISSKMAI